MFTQSDRIRDYVFPIATAERKSSRIVVKRILGSDFLIGNRGFALTAKHVIRGSEAEHLIAIFALSTGGWFSYEVMSREMHPEEDVALVKLSGGPWRSFFRLSNTAEYSSCKYRLFGYPDDTTYECTERGNVVIRPDLIYNEGYIRRRFNGELPLILGCSFFELSEVAGKGCSGAPVFKFTRPEWDVIGIYVGEKLNDRATCVSYAVREKAFREWEPNILGVSVLEESKNTNLT